MSGRHPFHDLTKDFTPERRARVNSRKAELRAAMPLHELRQARAMTQKAVGDVLNKRLPFTVRAPNATTAGAMKELDEGRGKRFGSAEELLRDLDIRDADSGIRR